MRCLDKGKPIHSCPIPVRDRFDQFSIRSIEYPLGFWSYLTSFVTEA
jgi:hypothetical protein